MPKIALVNMPFCSARAPSLQLGLIKALLTQAGLPTDTHHLNLDFAAAIGPELYELLSGTSDPMLGEWVFTGAAFPQFRKPPEYLATIPEFVERIRSATGTTTAGLHVLRDDIAPRFVREAARALAGYEVVGFTSTFQQNVPSIALAMEIKRLNPRATIVFGGANVEGSVGATLLESFPCIDVVVNGECDAFVGELFGALLRAENVDRFASVLTRENVAVRKMQLQRGLFSGDMDTLPAPDYAEFFLRRAELGLDTYSTGNGLLYEEGSEYAPYLPFESSRGCWWGQKHHCTFCGLNAGGMKFRARSYEATVELIAALNGQYKVDLLYAVDNIIDTRDLARFCDILIERDLGVEIFYEVKSNLRPAIIRKMAAAGIRYVQPGIESFSDHVLHLMRKGVSALHNLNTLRWLRSSNVRVAWNILYGFPGETLEDYEDQLALVRKIHHLPPPARLNRIRIDRYSPNFFDPELRKQFGELKMLDSYAYIYPDEVDRTEAAHFFYPREKPPATMSEHDVDELSREVEAWNGKWTSSAEVLGAVTGADKVSGVPFLRYERASDDTATIIDGRISPAEPEQIRLDPFETRLYEQMLDRPQDVRSLMDAPGFQDEDETTIFSSLSKFERFGLVHSIGTKTLALATADMPAAELRAQSVQSPALTNYQY